ncbi:hypothetical protein Tco_0013402 [Tanacetum coccineum]
MPKEHEADDDMGYDPFDDAFIEWLGSKCFNYKTMDHITMKALWIYWIRGTYIIGNQLHYQDYEWYEALEECKLKDDALRNKAIMEGFIKEDEDESRYEQKRRQNIYTNYDDAYKIYHEDSEREELCEGHELPMCRIRRYMLIKYSFNNDEEYVVVKEDEYNFPTITREEAYRAYQEIFRKMDEGWKDLEKEKKSTMLVENLRSGNFEVLES